MFSPPFCYRLSYKKKIKVKVGNLIFVFMSAFMTGFRRCHSVTWSMWRRGSPDGWWTFTIVFGWCSRRVWGVPAASGRSSWGIWVAMAGFRRWRRWYRRMSLNSWWAGWTRRTYDFLSWRWRTAFGPVFWIWTRWWTACVFFMFSGCAGMIYKVILLLV